MPTHMLITITVQRAQVGSVRKGSGWLIQPSFCSRTFTTPVSVSILETSIRLTNWGIAMVITKMVRHIFLNRMPFLLIMMARMMPNM